MSHNAGRITKIVVILSVVMLGFASCAFVYHATLKNMCYDFERDERINTPWCEDVWNDKPDELLRLDAATGMVASVFLIGSIVISLRKRRNRLDAALDCKIGAAIESFRDWHSREAHLREQSSTHVANADKPPAASASQE